MARLWQSGWELADTNAPPREWSIQAQQPNPQTSIVRTGTYAQKMDATLNGGYLNGIQFKAANDNGPFFATVYVYVAARPITTNGIMELDSTSGAVFAGMKLTSAGSLQLYDSTGSIGSTSAVLSLNTLYKLDLKVDVTGAAGSHVVEGRINGSVFTTSSSRSLATGFAVFYCAVNAEGEGDRTEIIYFDDCVINDTTGSFQNSYYTGGGITHLRPSADGDNHGFTVQTGGTAGAANNFTRVNDVTPDEATTYNGDAVLNDTDDFNIDDAPAAIGANDTINVVAVGIRYSAAIASLEASFVVRVKASSGGTVEESVAITPNSITWTTNANANPKIYPLVLYDLPGASTTPWTETDLNNAQIGYRISTGNTNAVNITAVWMSVDSTPAAITAPWTPNTISQPLFFDSAMSV